MFGNESYHGKVLVPYYIFHSGDLHTQRKIQKGTKRKRGRGRESRADN